MLSLWLIYVVMMLAVMESSSAAKILMASPPHPSHIRTQLVVGEELSRRGHDVRVAVASAYPNLDAIRRAGLGVVEYAYPPDVRHLASEQSERDFAAFVYDRSDPTAEFRLVSSAANRDCELMFSDERFLADLKSANFDLAIVDLFILSPCTLLLPRFLGVPFVTMSAIIFPWSMRVPALPSFYGFQRAWNARVPDFDRFVDRLGMTLHFLTTWFVVLPTFHAATPLLEKYGNGSTSFAELTAMSELFLLTVDHHLDFALPSMPNVVHVAGFSARPARPLPDDLERVVSATVDGVIVVSFGSTGYHMPDATAIKLLDAFSRLNQTVIARIRVPDGLTIPDNVRLAAWLPQNDLLGDRRTKLFVTHCGNAGQYEALYHGVPMLGFPMYAEQWWNCDRMVRKGFGLQLDIVDFTSDELVASIEQLIANRTFADRIGRASTIWRSEPMIGREKAAFWIEHVLEFGGQHLRSPGSRQPLYQFLMLDVIGVCLGVVVLAACVLFVVILLFVRLIAGFARYKMSGRVKKNV